MDNPSLQVTAEDLRAVLQTFGVNGAEVRREATLTSVVYRIATADRLLYLKRHPSGSQERLLWALRVSESLRRAEVRAPCFVRGASGQLFEPRAEHVFAMTEALAGSPLIDAALADSEHIRGVSELLARIHETLNGIPDAAVPPVPPMWDDADLARRASSARRVIAARPSTPATVRILRALAAVERRAPDRVPLHATSRHHGIVHGDFWPGNLLAGPEGASDIAVLEPESACRAPLLLDVAHYVDLAFRGRDPHGGLALDLDAATEFTHAYAERAGLAPAALGDLPDVLLAARECSILWIAERYLEVGPSPLDPLIENDLAVIGFLERARGRWAEELEGALRRRAR